MARVSIETHPGRVMKSLGSPGGGGLFCKGKLSLANGGRENDDGDESCGGGSTHTGVTPSSEANE